MVIVIRLQDRRTGLLSGDCGYEFIHKRSTVGWWLRVDTPTKNSWDLMVSQAENSLRILTTSPTAWGIHSFKSSVIGGPSGIWFVTSMGFLATCSESKQRSSSLLEHPRSVALEAVTTQQL
jgi:hypothetical protein